MDEKLIEILKSCQHCMDDYAQRSALGIADSFVRGGRVDLRDVKYAPEGHPASRDGLADALIAAIVDEGADVDENRAALRDARKFVNAPFTDNSKLLAWREQRHAKYPKGIGAE